MILSRAIKLLAQESYLYHATIAPNLLGIYEEGLKPSEETNWGGMLGEESVGKIYFAYDEASARYYGDIIAEAGEYIRSEPDPENIDNYIDVPYLPEVLVLRIKREDISIEKSKEAAECWTTESIPPEKIEVLFGEHGWKKLKSISKDAIEGIAVGEWDEPRKEFWNVESSDNRPIIVR